MIQEIKSVEFVYKGKIEVDSVTKNKIKEYWEKLKKEKDFLKHIISLKMNLFELKLNCFYCSYSSRLMGVLGSTVRTSS